MPGTQVTRTVRQLCSNNMLRFATTVCSKWAGRFDGSTVQMHNGTSRATSQRVCQRIVGDPARVPCLSRDVDQPKFLPNFIYTKTLKDTARWSKSSRGSRLETPARPFHKESSSQALSACSLALYLWPPKMSWQKDKAFKFGKVLHLRFGWC